MDANEGSMVGKSLKCFVFDILNFKLIVEVKEEAYVNISDKIIIHTPSTFYENITQQSYNCSPSKSCMPNRPKSSHYLHALPTRNFDLPIIGIAVLLCCRHISSKQAFYVYGRN